MFSWYSIPQSYIIGEKCCEEISLSFCEELIQLITGKRQNRETKKSHSKKWLFIKTVNPNLFPS
jgi:hypothetical protein